MRLGHGKIIKSLTRGNHCPVLPAVLVVIPISRKGTQKMLDFKNSTTEEAWDKLSYEEKNYVLYERQKALLDLFLEKNAISKVQHDKSLHDLTVKMAGAVTREMNSGGG